MDWQSVQSWFSSPETNTGLLIQVFGTVFVTLLLNLIWRKIHTKFQNKLTITKTVWDDAVWTALREPVGWLIWVLGLFMAITLIKIDLGQEQYQWLSNARNVILIVIFSWFLFRLITSVEKNLLLDMSSSLDEDAKLDPTTIHALAKLFRASVIITSVLAVMQTLQIPISGLLAFGGVGGLAVGLAAKDLLANFFGGLTIYLDRPFKVGDWIRSPERQIEGTVEYIGWRQTRIRTFDQRPLYVPNSAFTNISVENPSRMLNRRIYETIGLRYEDADKIKEIISDVEKMLRQHKEIDLNKTLIVNFNEFAPSSLDFFVYTFTKTTNWVYFHEVKQQILLQILEIIEQAGAQVAFPSSSLYVEKLPEIKS